MTYTTKFTLLIQKKNSYKVMRKIENIPIKIFKSYFLSNLQKEKHKWSVNIKCQPDFNEIKEIYSSHKKLTSIQRPL